MKTKSKIVRKQQTDNPQYCLYRFHSQNIAFQIFSRIKQTLAESNLKTTNNFNTIAQRILAKQ